MDEKTIINSEQYDIKRICKIILIICAAICFIGFLLWCFNYHETRQHIWYSGGTWTPREEHISKYSLWDNIIYGFGDSSYIAGRWIEAGLILSIITTIIMWALSSYSITVTNKRVFGKTKFGKRVDLPIDSISAIAMSAFKGIAVATSSGKIKFGFIKNRDEIHKVISNLLIERQKSSKNETTKTGYQPASASPINKPAASVSGTEEIKKYKELLDSGIITQEEFDAKKKQLLGL